MQHLTLARFRNATLVPWVASLLAVLVLGAPALVRAQEGDASASAVHGDAAHTLATPEPHTPASVGLASPIRPPRERTPVAEYAGVWAGAGVAALAAGLTLYFIPGPRPADPSIGVWRGGLLFDDSFRSALRAPTIAGENIAATASDYLLVATMVNAAVVDGIALPLFARQDPDLAWQAGFAYSLAVGLELSLGGLVKDVSMRARPYEASQCAANPSLPICQNSTTYESFFSLHTGVAFTSAGFSCSMHLERALYGDQAADIFSCGSSIAAASAVGILRVVADAHYLTDVLVGAATGFLIGYLVPLVVIPHRVSAAAIDIRRAALDADPDAEPIASDPATTWSMAPMVDLGLQNGTVGTGGVTLGASVSGTF